MGEKTEGSDAQTKEEKQTSESTYNIKRNQRQMGRGKKENETEET